MLAMENFPGTTTVNNSKTIKKQRLIISIDNLIEIITFLNCYSALRLSLTSRLFKRLVEKSPLYPSPRIIPDFTLTSHTFPDNSVQTVYIKVEPSYGIERRKPLPHKPPSLDVYGIRNIFIKFPLAEIPLDVTNFIININHLLVSHYIAFDFQYIYDFYYSGIVWGTFPPKFRLVSSDDYISNNLISLTNVLTLLNHFSTSDHFPYIRVSQFHSLLFTLSTRSECMFTNLLNTSFFKNRRYLEIEHDVYSQNRSAHALPLQLSGIVKWLFSSHNKLLKFYNVTPNWALSCQARGKRFIIELLISLLNTVWIKYSFLIIHPICSCCTENLFLSILTAPELSRQFTAVNRYQYERNYCSFLLSTSELFELFHNNKYLFIRRRSLFGPIHWELESNSALSIFEQWRYCHSYIKIDLQGSDTISPLQQCKF